jgi:hypothetical protein
MDWIKQHTDQFTLALLALALLVLSVLVFLRTQSFADGFSDAQKTPVHSKEIPPVDDSTIATAEKELTTPTLWTPKPDGGSLFVSNPLLLNDKGQLEYAKSGTTHPPVPNIWLIKYGLNVLSPTILEDDADKDGFTNLDEYLGPDRSEANGDKDSTDPRNKESHPPYYTKLFLNRQHAVPFRLLFNAYDADPKSVPVENINFQINTLDLRQPTEFLKIGDTVPNTKYKLVKFEYKIKKDESSGIDEDVSELIVENEETKEQIILVYQKTINSPTYFAIFDYLWPDSKNPKQFAVKKGDPFSLEPNKDDKYKLVDVTKTEAPIEIPGGGTYTVPLTSAKGATAPAAPGEAAAPPAPETPATPAVRPPAPPPPKPPAKKTKSKP